MSPNSPSSFRLPEELKDLIHKYPLFIVLLYLERDEKLRSYIHDNIGLIDNLSGYSCLIWLPEPVGSLSDDLRNRWGERLDTIPDWFQSVIDSEQASFEKISCSLAESFGVPPNKIPGFIVAEPHQTQFFYDRFDQDTSLKEQIDDLVASAQAAQTCRKSKRTKAFRKEWETRRHSSKKVVLGYVECFNEWLGVIRDTEKNILDILLPISPLLQSFLEAFTLSKEKP